MTNSFEMNFRPSYFVLYSKILNSDNKTWAYVCPSAFFVVSLFSREEGRCYPGCYWKESYSLSMPEGMWNNGTSLQMLSECSPKTQSQCKECNAIKTRIERSNFKTISFHITYLMIFLLLFLQFTLFWLKGLFSLCISTSDCYLHW